MMRRSTRVIAITVLLALVLLLAMTVPALAGKTLRPALPELGGGNWVDGTYSMMQEKEQATRAMAAKFGVQSLIPNAPAGLQGPPPPVAVGAQYTFELSDDAMQSVYDQDFIVQGIGQHCIVLIEQYAWDNVSDGVYPFPNPNNTWGRSYDYISGTQLDYMRTTFDNQIWPTMSSTFGTPLPRGSEGDKVWILIFNIRDDAYYSDAAETYIAGYFSSAEDAENVKNMIHIDTYDWADRIGPDSERPYLYEGVFAHEYQHLLHFDSDPDEESWVDEGMADLAAFLCGFMEDNGHVLYYLAYFPYTSLTFWGGGLENYGADYLFQLYLYEQYGGAMFTKYLFHDQANGIPGVQNALNKYGKKVKFDTVFDNWTLANYFDYNVPSKYGYRNIDLGPDTNGYTLQWFLDNWYTPWGFLPTDPQLVLPFSTPGSLFYNMVIDDQGNWVPWVPQPYTAHYYMTNPYAGAKFTLDGDDTAGIPAYSGTKQMLSGADAWSWRSFYQTFAVPAGTSTLSFWTNFDIEENWDYGYVEIYDQTAVEWYTLPLTGGAPTTTVLAIPQDSPNVPTDREPEWYASQTPNRWNGLTGSSNGWVQESGDLSPFAGHTITIYFRTWQDGAFTLRMMYVDDVAIDWATGTDYFCDFESGLGGWATPAAGDTAAWSRGSGLFANDWQGTLVRLPGQTLFGRASGLAVYNTKMSSYTQKGTVAAKGNAWRPVNWMYVVSNRADHILASDYYLQAWPY
jgi:immune inhibitor A